MSRENGRMRIAVVPAFIVCASLCVGCGGGGSPPSPSPTPTPPPADPGTSVPNLAGTWSGTLQSSAFETRSISASIVQSADCVDGAWKTTSTEWSGAISGFALPGSFQGFLSIEGAQGSSGLCAGVFRTTGSASNAGIKWTFENDGQCAGGIRQTVTFVLRR